VLLNSNTTETWRRRRQRDLAEIEDPAGMGGFEDARVGTRSGLVVSHGDGQGIDSECGAALILEDSALDLKTEGRVAPLQR
jgi:hypothetical protein